jgi:hypothetical protein
LVIFLIIKECTVQGTKNFIAVITSFFLLYKKQSQNTTSHIIVILLLCDWLCFMTVSCTINIDIAQRDGFHQKYSQVPAICPYPEPAPSSPHNPLPLPEDPSTSGSPQWSPSLRLPHQNPVHTSPLPHGFVALGKRKIL